MSHKNLTILFIVIGIVAFAFNFWVFQQLSFDQTMPTLQALAAQKVKPGEQSKVLPDIKKGEPIAKSEIRNQELAKITPQLPYSDPEVGYNIVYYDSGKTLTVEIPAKTVNDYRLMKFQAEAKLTEMGTANLCNLVIFWAPPATLNRELTKADLVTTGCK